MAHYTFKVTEKETNQLCYGGGFVVECESEVRVRKLLCSYIATKMLFEAIPETAKAEVGGEIQNMQIAGVNDLLYNAGNNAEKTINEMFIVDLELVK